MSKIPDTAHAVLTADEEYIGHSGRKHLAERLARDSDETEPENAPHQVREVSWDWIRENDSNYGAKNEVDDGA